MSQHVPEEQVLIVSVGQASVYVDTQVAHGCKSSRVGQFSRMSTTSGSRSILGTGTTRSSPDGALTLSGGVLTIAPILLDGSSAMSGEFVMPSFLVLLPPSSICTGSQTLSNTRLTLGNASHAVAQCSSLVQVVLKKTIWPAYSGVVTRLSNLLDGECSSSALMYSLAECTVPLGSFEYIRLSASARALAAPGVCTISKSKSLIVSSH